MSKRFGQPRYVGGFTGAGNAVKAETGGWVMTKASGKGGEIGIGVDKIGGINCNAPVRVATYSEQE